MSKSSFLPNNTTAHSVFSVFLFSAIAISSTVSVADEGGASFWLPGQFGSLTATPQEAGWSFATVYYHTTIRASGTVGAAREITINGLSSTASANLNVKLDARADLMLLIPSYVFASPVFGGQLAVSMSGIYGRTRASVDGTLTAALGSNAVTRMGALSDSMTNVGDLYPQATLRWNHGIHNYMVYATGDIPVGSYDPTRLANIGLGHGALDGGFGYTYFDPAKGHEFSVVTGLTYNLKNSETQYRNGVDLHLDWGASQFVSKTLFVGAVGYFYNQLTNDSGAAVFLDGFKSHVAAIGPQIGFLFPVGNMQGHIGLKSYFEFNAANRPEGWNAWVTFAISPAALGEPATAQRRPMTTK